MLLIFKKFRKEKKTKLFVGNLWYGTEAESLHTYFERYGYVRDAVIIKDVTNKSRGFGFVIF
jgi:RNA recognition motif-containing protein